MEEDDKEEVIILLSTYNGEKYVAEQLDSILQQKDVTVNIVIRDDGSKDSTLGIINDFRNKFKGKIDLIVGRNIGWKKSFFELIQYADDHYSDKKYFAFSDQDDIWLPDKLINGIRLLETLHNPIKLYCSNLLGLKENGEKILIRRDYMKPTYKNCLVINRATGCTVLFNKNLLRVISHSDVKTPVAHDQWLYMVAVLCGEVIIDSIPHILYRLHDNNQIGNKTGLLEVWKRRIRDYKNPDNSRLRESCAKDLLANYKAQMNEEAYKVVAKIALYRQNIISRLRLFWDRGYTTGNKWNDLFIRIRILLGIL